MITGNFRYAIDKNNIILPVTGRGGLLGCETLRIIHLLDIWLIDGSEDVRLSDGRAFIN
jgi:hypothetical protein